MCEGASEGKNDLLTSMYNVRFLSSFLSITITFTYTRTSHYHVSSGSHFANVSQFILAPERERERERDFNAIINLHISNCCHGTMFSIWFLWYARLIIHEKGDDSDFCNMEHGTCILNFQNFTNWDPIMSSKFLSCFSNLVLQFKFIRSLENWNSQKKIQFNWNPNHR